MKYLFIFILLLFLIPQIHVFSAPDINSNSIVAIWLFDEGKGDTILDSSGNKHDGKIIGDVKWTDGKYKKALEFKGIATTRVEVPHDPSLTLMEWTITAWANYSLHQEGIGQLSL